MIPTTDGEVIRHHVSICGRVVDGDGKPMPCIKLSAIPDENRLEPAQAADTKTGGRRESGKARKEATRILKPTRQTESRPDGTFFFLDCPDGQYTVIALDPRSGAQHQKSVSAARSAMGKKTKDRGPEEGYWIELVLKE